MIFSDALRSLKDDPGRTFFYFLTFFLTTFLLFLFFNMGVSEQAVSEEFIMHGEANIFEFMENGDIVNLMMAYVVIICCVDIIFANSFFIRNKAEELAVRLVCGATFTQLAFYLLIQTFLLLVIAIPLGIAAAAGTIPLVNSFLVSQLDSPFLITVSSEAVTNFTVIILMVVFWTTTLNLSFAYQNEAAAILNGTGTSREKTGSIFGGLLAKIPDILKALLGIGVLVYMFISIFRSPSGSAEYALIALLGVELVLMFALIPLITKYIDGRGMKKPLGTIVFSFLREDLKAVKVNIYLFIGNAAVLAAMLVMRSDHILAVVMILSTYIIMNFMQAMALMFRLATHLSERSAEYNVLAQTGYEPEQQTSILRSEMCLFYLFTLFASCALIGCTLASMTAAGLIASVYMIIMMASMVLPLLLMWVLSTISYKRTAHIQDMIHSIEESRR